MKTTKNKVKNTQKVRVSPAIKARRGGVSQVQNKGYSEAGASFVKKALKGMIPSSGDTHEDIDFNNLTLRQRSRMLYMGAPIATSAIRTNRTNVVGNGLRLKSTINREALGMTQEAAEAWQKHTEAEFELWASRKNACDATGVNDFYGLQQLAVMAWLMSGDVFAIVKRYPATPMMPYGLRLPASPAAFLLFLASLLLGLVIVCALCMLIYGLTFYTMSPSGLRMFATSAVSIFSGELIPLSFLPGRARRRYFALFFLPCIWTTCPGYDGMAGRGEGKFPAEKNSQFTNGRI